MSVPRTDSPNIVLGDFFLLWLAVRSVPRRRRNDLTLLWFGTAHPNVIFPAVLIVHEDLGTDTRKGYSWLECPGLKNKRIEIATETEMTKSVVLEGFG